MRSPCEIVSLTPERRKVPDQPVLYRAVWLDFANEAQSARHCEVFRFLALVKVVALRVAIGHKGVEHGGHDIWFFLCGDVVGPVAVPTWGEAPWVCGFPFVNWKDASGCYRLEGAQWCSVAEPRGEVDVWILRQGDVLLNEVGLKACGKGRLGDAQHAPKFAASLGHKIC
jgi:hypothetical protein